MTVSTTDTLAGPFDGNDSATSFPFSNIKVLQNSDLTVVHTDAAGAETTLAEGTDYTLSLNSDQDSSPGGTISYPVSGGPLPTGEKLTGKRILAQTQTTDLANQSKYDANVVETSFDKAIMLIQSLQEEVGRAVKVTMSSGDDPDALIASIETSESNAATSAAAALVSEVSSLISEVAAAASDTYAEEWANKAEDSLISAAAGGDTVDDYSALHHANKAAASAATSAELSNAVAGTDTYTATLGISSYTTNKTYPLTFANTNTTASTLEFDSLGAKPFTRPDGSALQVGDVPLEGFVRYDGTNLCLLNPRVATASINQGALATKDDIHTSEIATGGGTSSTGSSSDISMTGGRYLFWPQVRNTTAAEIVYMGAGSGLVMKAVSASYVSAFSLAATVGTAHVQWLYVDSSPPHDMGDGDIPLFIFAEIDNSTKELLNIYFADDPIWLHAGKTNNYPDGKDKKGSFQMVRNVPASVKALQGQEKLSALKSLPKIKKYITQPQKHRDMNDIPHPFLNDLTGKTVIMLDPVSNCVRELSELRAEGEDIDAILRGNYINVGNEDIGRVTPGGILVPSADWKP